MTGHVCWCVFQKLSDGKRRSGRAAHGSDPVSSCPLVPGRWTHTAAIALPTWYGRPSRHTCALGMQLPLQACWVRSKAAAKGATNVLAALPCRSKQRNCPVLRALSHRTHAQPMVLNPTNAHTKPVLPPCTVRTKQPSWYRTTVRSSAQRWYTMTGRWMRRWSHKAGAYMCCNAQPKCAMRQIKMCSEVYARHAARRRASRARPHPATPGTLAAMLMRACACQ